MGETRELPNIYSISAPGSTLGVFHETQEKSSVGAFGTRRGGPRARQPSAWNRRGPTLGRLLLSGSKGNNIHPLKNMQKNMKIKDPHQLPPSCGEFRVKKC